MIVRFLQNGLVIIVAALLTFLGFQARTHFTNVQEKDSVERLLISQLRLDPRQANVSVTEAMTDGTYFFQFSVPREADLSISYGWIRPKACADGTSERCIEFSDKSATISTASRLDNAPREQASELNKPRKNANAAGSNSEVSEDAAPSIAEDDNDVANSGTSIPKRTLPTANSQQTTASTGGSQQKAESPSFRMTAPNDTHRRAGEPLFRVTAPNVNLRNGPGTDFEVVDVITPSVRFSIVEQSDDWSKVATVGSRRVIQGWIWSELIAPETR